ncbi:MAG: hypothetical protein ACRCUE_04365 [Bosea sp. (in: a-proteobacteria)]
MTTWHVLPVTLALLTGAALAQTPATIPPATAPSAPTYAPTGPAMTFRIAEGSGPRGATRWVSATGQIQADSAVLFALFAKTNRIEGLTLVLDSTGGRVRGAMLLGRQIRAAKLNTSVGRTISLDGKDAVRSNEVGCSSACVLVLMGGVERFVPEDASVNVHMFSVEIDAEGNKARGEPSFRDIEQTQRTMAAHAVYIAEMGVAARFLEIMTEASFRGTMRRITKSEMEAIKLASVMPRDVSVPVAGNWFLSAATAPAQLIRTSRLTDTDKLVVNHELLIECDVVRSFFLVTYRQQLIRFDGPKGGSQPVTVASARLDTGGWDFIFRAPGRGFGINAVGNDFWMRRSVPRKVFEDAAANGRLTVELVAQGRPTRTSSLHDASLRQLLPGLSKRCDARPGLVSTGPNPRR